MFKKRVIRKPTAQQRRKTNDDDEGEEEEDVVRKQLEMTKKRRKLLENLQYKHGVDAIELLTSSTDQGKKEQGDGITSSSANNNVNVMEGKSVWEQKHAAAMEEFVRSKLQTVHQDTNDSNNNNHNEKEETASKSKLLTKTELYRELAQQLQSNKDSSTEQAAASKDVLRAGAATALSEVILPVQDRIETMTQTQQAMKKGSSNIDSKSLPTTTAASGLPHRFQSTVKRIQPSTMHPDPSLQNDNDENDKDRIGFQAILMRSQQQDSDKTSTTDPSSSQRQQQQKQKRASDDRVYKEFIKRQHQQQRK